LIMPTSSGMETKAKPNPDTVCVKIARNTINITTIAADCGWETAVCQPPLNFSICKDEVFDTAVSQC
ncbi:MAG: hypothetical protein GY943_21870, partial [Chloroflexi bacterium]|nr:hypothetical protein [Chloroflexota bacterium]